MAQEIIATTKLACGGKGRTSWPGYWEGRSIVPKASSQIAEAKCSTLAHARARAKISLAQTCASMVAGQEEGVYV
jgi:hypothetical protein